MSEFHENELRENLRASYNKYAQERDSHGIQDWKANERAKFLALLQQEGKRTMLEIGAGTGWDGKFFQDHGIQMTCVDLSPAMVELCRQKGLAALVMDIGELNFPSASFDAVYSMNSLLHLPKAEFPGVLASVDALLKPGGVVFIGVYGGRDHEGIFEEDFYTPQRFFSFFTDAHIQREAEKVFEILSFETIEYEPGAAQHFQSLMLRKKASLQTPG